MTKKHEAAQVYAKKAWKPFNNSEGDIKVTNNDFSEGWTQGLEELMKLAREKVLVILTYPDGIAEQSTVIKLSDLEAIIKELEK